MIEVGDSNVVSLMALVARLFVFFMNLLYVVNKCVVFLVAMIIL